MFLRFVCIAAVLFATGCQEGTLQGADGPDIFVPTCDIIVQETVPSVGAANAYYRAPIEFHLTQPDMGAVIVTDIPGVQSFRDEGRVVVWTPSDALEPSTNYSVGLEYCGGRPSLDFATSAFGTPVEIPIEDFVGRTYAVDLTGGRFLAGQGLADLAATMFTKQMLLHVVAIDDDAVDLRIALSQPGGSDDLQQDMCVRTLDLPPASLKFAPYMSFTAQDVAFGSYHSDINLLDVELTGAIAPDGSAVGGATFAATVNAEDIATAFEIADVETLCEFAENLGLPCGACPDDSANTCVTVEADHILAPEVPGLSVEEVTSAETHQDCIVD